MLTSKTKNNLIPIGRDSFNYYDRSSLASLLRKIKFTFVINAAGYTGKPNVDACELAKAECLSGNAYYPGLFVRFVKI